MPTPDDNRGLLKEKNRTASDYSFHRTSDQSKRITALFTDTERLRKAVLAQPAKNRYEKRAKARALSAIDRRDEAIAKQALAHGNQAFKNVSPEAKPTMNLWSIIVESADNLADALDMVKRIEAANDPDMGEIKYPLLRDTLRSFYSGDAGDTSTVLKQFQRDRTDETERSMKAKPTSANDIDAEALEAAAALMRAGGDWDEAIKEVDGE